MTGDNFKRTIEKVNWYEKMAKVYKILPDDVKNQIEEWLKANKGKGVSEWPGWEHHIGKKPD